MAPEPAQAVRAWILSSGVAVHDVLSLSPSVPVGLHTTPTLALVASRGVTTDLWIGSLGPDQQRAFLARVRGDARGPALVPERLPGVVGIGTEPLRLLRRAGALLLDVRERGECAADRRRPAVCLPLAELAIRVGAEFDPAVPIVVDCSRLPPVSCVQAAEELFGDCFTRVSVAVAGTPRGLVEIW